PGWYLAVGDAGFCRREEGPLVRLYFALAGPAAAPGLLGATTATLNALGLPFQVKVANHADGYVRRDPFIVYLHRSRWERHRRALAALQRGYAAMLRDDGPCFAYELARGWWLADEPVVAGRPVSFGQHRCLLAAEALVDACERGWRSPTGRLAAIAERYHRAGIDLAHPYRNPPEHRNPPEQAV
ncbi:MAG TPA: T3SS effector HopA1 family protein, partial [Frankiaceae bacterium]|nr:T3SS effector HopA1 family protein [Frankiaceae bacterium]